MLGVTWLLFVFIPLMVLNTYSIFRSRGYEILSYGNIFNYNSKIKCLTHHIEYKWPRTANVFMVKNQKLICTG